MSVQTLTSSDPGTGERSAEHFGSLKKSCSDITPFVQLGVKPIRYHVVILTAGIRDCISTHRTKATVLQELPRCLACDRFQPLENTERGKCDVTTAAATLRFPGRLELQSEMATLVEAVGSSYPMMVCLCVCVCQSVCQSVC